MTKDEVIEELMNKKRPAKIVFRKANDELREMWCSRSAYHVPERDKPKYDPNKPKRKENQDICTVYNIDDQVWRSFRWDRLISVNGVNYTHVEEKDTFLKLVRERIEQGGK